MNFVSTIKFLLAFICASLTTMTPTQAAPQFRYDPRRNNYNPIYNYPRHIPGYSNYAPFSNDYNELNTDDAYRYYTNLLRQPAASRKSQKAIEDLDYYDYAAFHSSFG